MDLGEILNQQIFFVILGAIISDIILGSLTSSLYSQKGYTGGFWMGFFLGIVGLIYAAGLPDSKVRNGVSKTTKKTVVVDSGIDPDDRKKYTICPVCGWRVYDDEECCCSCGYKI